MRLGVETPGILVDVTRLGGPRSHRGHRRRRAAHRRRGHATATWRPIRASGRAIRCSRSRAARRLGPAPQPGHGRREPAPAHALRVLHGRDQAVQQAPAADRAARRARATTTTTRSSATPSTASPPTRPTWRWRWPRSRRPCTSRAGRARGRSRYPGCTACRTDEPQRDTVLEPGELITAVELAAARPAETRQRYRKVRERRSFAFALVSVAAVLDSRRRRVARRPHRARRRRPCAVAGQPGRGGAPRPGPDHARNASQSAAGPSSTQAEPLRDNAYKVELARNLIVRTLLRAGRREHRRRRRDRRRDRPGRGTREGHRPGPVRLRVPPGRGRLRRDHPVDGRQGDASATSTPARRSSCRACSRSSGTATRPGCTRSPTASSRSCSRTEVAYRGQIVGAVIAGQLRDRAPGRAAGRDRVRGRAPRRSAPRRPPRPVQARQGQPELSRPTPRRATSTPRSPPPR